MQDFGGPVGFGWRVNTRTASRSSWCRTPMRTRRDCLTASGLHAKALWADPSKENFQIIRDAAISDDAIARNYTHGVRMKRRSVPAAGVLQRALLNRPGNKEIMLDLLYDYRSNPPLYPQWQAYFRAHQPPALIVLGQERYHLPGGGRASVSAGSKGC